MLVLAVALVTQSVWLVVIVALAVTLQTGTATVENCLIARYTPAAWRATIYGMKFVLALGLSSLGRAAGRADRTAAAARSTASSGR